MDKAILTCALTGVLTNPKQHPVPVTAAQMAEQALEAFRAGAAVMHLHFRQPEEGKGHLPCWDPEICFEISERIRDACPGVIINQTTGVIGSDTSPPAAVMRRLRPEIAACNAGSLNYLKIKKDGSWAWPPMVFDNPVEKIAAMLEVMDETGAQPEFECFDVGIVRAVDMFVRRGLVKEAHYNFVMGVASGMPVDGRLLRLLLEYRREHALWQATLIGRGEIWPVHQEVADLGGMLRTGLEDTFYLPNGEKASGNGGLIEALASCAEQAGRAVASPDEARSILGLRAA